MRDYEFGNFIHDMRKKKGLSQFQLGALLGVSDKAVSKWENGLAKPQSNILYKLCEILDISADELLAGKCHNERELKGIFADQTPLYKSCHKRFSDIYGENVPAEILIRYISETEDMALRNSELMVLYSFISKLKSAAEETGHYFEVRDIIGNSFTAYILGATDINPLRAHYFCPDCKKVEFAEDHKCGWDLPERYCDCGSKFIRDGHNLPYENAIRFKHFDIFISKDFINEAKKIAEDYFDDNRIVYADSNEECETFVIVNDGRTHQKHAAPANITELMKAYPSFSFRKTDYNPISLLEKESGIKPCDADFCSEDVLTAMLQPEVCEAFELKSQFAQDIIKKSKAGCFSDLIQVLGLCHGAGVWKDNGELLLDRGINIGDIPAYREDIFNYVQDRLIKKGLYRAQFAAMVMESTRRGRLKKGRGINATTRNCFDEIGVEEWFIDYICKVDYLFPKAFAVNRVRRQMILMWYKIHFPEAFGRIFKG